MVLNFHSSHLIVIANTSLVLLCICFCPKYAWCVNSSFSHNNPKRVVPLSSIYKGENEAQGALATCPKQRQWFLGYSQSAHDQPRTFFSPNNKPYIYEQSLPIPLYSLRQPLIYFLYGFASCELFVNME